ncbi:unnamed protein product [Cylicocyclus nassatus]|uniref:Uncharacterized protein n=1 Tax=Cylicocyclus nassatus TaxID=53992 RepID=A0AA36H8G5_CYLNA|nr:unnamed protein product [Cylicocyclus nassatus]
MSLDLAIYIVYVLVNSLIVILNVVVIWAAVESRELRHNPAIHIVLTAIICQRIQISNIAAPLYTRYCGFAYLVSGHYWYFDFEKPYTYFYKELNQILQIGCGAFVLISDIIIIFKIIRLRALELHEQSGNGFLKDWKFGTESRIAINFLVMSSCYLFMSAFFNIDMGYGFWHILILKLSTLLNLSKWALYLLANTSIYKVIGRKLGVQSHHHIPPSMTNRTQF